MSEALLEKEFEFSPRLLRALNAQELTLAQRAAIFTAIQHRYADGAMFALRVLDAS